MPPSDLSHLPAPPLPTVPHFAPSLPIETVTPVRISTVVEGILLSVCAMADKVKQCTDNKYQIRLCT